MASFSEVEAEITRLAEERQRGDAFERVVAHFLRHDPSLGMRRVWTWLDWPGRLAAGIRATDLGIDLVAEDELGRLVGVQVKFRIDPPSHLRWEEVSTAIAFRPDLFARRLIITNAADRTANARRATEMTSDMGWVLREDLLASPIDWTGALIAGTGEAEPSHLDFKPRPYQASAIGDVVASLIDHERTQLVMACGSGKTLVTLWIAEALASKRVLVLVPTLLLLKQFRREWRQAARQPFVDLAVCSDADTVEPDEWRVRSDELGVPVTTDPIAIASFLRGPDRRVVFATYASSARVAEGQTDPSVPAFDLVVADEAHRIAGVMNTGVHRERDLRVVLDAHGIRADRRLFATATPRVYGPATRRRTEGLDDVELASMDDSALFGPVAHRLWFRKAVELGVLSDYELVAVLVTEEEVADQVRKRAGVIVDGLVLDAETLATLIAVRRAIDDLGLTRAITFHHTIARARAFAHALAGIELPEPAPNAEHISGAMSVDERERVLRVLREPERPTVVTNARCLSEGIDVPSLDAIAFVDPRSSAVDIVQAVGRVMRRAPGKDRGFVVVPVFLREEDLADPEAAVASSAFAPVLDVLRALRAHDPELTADASRIKASLGSREVEAGGHIAEHVRLVGHRVDPAAFERALELRFVEVSASWFDVGLAALRAFVAREGHARVPKGYVDRGFRLGDWVINRRRDRKVGRLGPTQVTELEMFPAWSWDPFADAWAAGLNAMRAFTAREGHARVPSTHVEDLFWLGKWASKQRADHKVGTLSAKQAAELSELPGWSWDPISEEWESALVVLRAFVEREGQARVPQRHVERGFRIGSWVSSRRMEHSSGELAPDRAAELEALPGWSWVPFGDDWATALAGVRSFADREGHARVPYDHLEGGVRIGAWVTSRRTEHNSGRLAPYRAAQLEVLPNWSWDPIGDDWAMATTLLRIFSKREGHARVPSKWVEGGFRLGSFVNRCRIERKTGSLGAARVAELEAVPGWSWDPFADDWIAGIAALTNFIAHEGHLRVPSRHVEHGVRLANWVASRRRERAAGRLSPDRVAELEMLPGWSWHPYGGDWIAALAALRIFIDREGHSRVPRGHFEGEVRLGSWVKARRSEFNSGRIGSAELAELEAIPGWTWNARQRGRPSRE